MMRALDLYKPQRTAEAGTLAEFDLRRIAAEAGCTVLETSEIALDGKVVTKLELDCGTNENAIKFLSAAARRDAWDPRVVDRLAWIVKDAGVRFDVSDTASVVQSWVQENVAFRREKDERFQSAWLTLTWKMGDCDDHARLVAALLFAAGCEARVVGVANAEGRLVHVCAQVRDAGAWQWVETTVRGATYGEEPKAAARRLGLLHDRPDVGA